MKALLVLSLFVSVSLAADWSREDRQFFNQWRKKFGKQYRSSAEEKEAIANVLYHKKNIDAHNKLYEQGEETYEQRLNEHSDLSEKEMLRYLGGIQFPHRDPNQDDRSKRKAEIDSVGAYGSTAPIPEYPKGPNAIDWRDHGLVGPVFNQGDFCGSCWAFATAALVEAAMRKRNKDNTFHVSPQQLIDCATKKNHGCSGGWPSYGLDYVRKSGIAKEEDYPYAWIGGNDCYYDKSMESATVKEVYNVPTKGNEEYMKNIVGEVGPIGVLICLDNKFQHFGSGFYTSTDCCNTTDSHAPIIVGYGTDKKHGDYWIMKNSYGTSWGEDGYVKFKRGENLCNVGQYAIYAT